MEAPPHSTPVTLGYTSPAPPLLPPLLSEEEIAEQCGRSENGHSAWSPKPGQVFSRPWTLTSGCLAVPGRPHVQASSLLGDVHGENVLLFLQFVSSLGWSDPQCLPSLLPFLLCQGPIPFWTEPAQWKFSQALRGTDGRNHVISSFLVLGGWWEPLLVFFLLV